MRIIQPVLLYVALVVVTFSSCKGFMEPNLDNYKDEELIERAKNDFVGVLNVTYESLPTRMNFTYEAATDNAVTNNESTVASRSARGELTAMTNLFGDVWTNDYKAINNLNWYIEHMVLDYSKPLPTPVRFDIDPDVNMQYFYFTLGEAYFMRAWFQFDLLQKYGGVAADGKAYGFPISTEFLEVGMNLDRQRNTYQECVERIAADCDSAFKYLPLDYSQKTGTLLDGVSSESGHASGAAAKALKARAYLYAASPAYNMGNDVAKWKKAAEVALEAINAIGLRELMSFEDYFSKTKLNDNGQYANAYNYDIFFRGPIQKEVTVYEKENFPPRAGSGGGYINPTQNLVDAFPMKDGYPRTASSPQNPYDANDMYSNRDPRLDLFIVRSGETFAGIAIDTYIGGPDSYGTDVNATRSGYYLQKLLDKSVRIAAGSTVTTSYAVILLGRPELYLNFAEAVMMATGNPDSQEYQYSPRDILRMIRNRAFGAEDVYFDQVTDPSEFMELIKNERRIELCFEDHRFWDLRRWSSGLNDMEQINTPAYGLYSTEPLEDRSYKSPYMPLPYSEMIKTENLVNNIGWE